MKPRNGKFTRRRPDLPWSGRCPWQFAAGGWEPHRAPCAWEPWYNDRPHGGIGHGLPVAGRHKNPAVQAGRKPRAASTLSCEGQGVGSDKFGFQGRFPILQQHGDHLAQVVGQFVKGLPLRVGAGKTGDITDQKACRTIPFNDGLKICFHKAASIPWKDVKRQARGQRMICRRFS